MYKLKKETRKNKLEVNKNNYVEATHLLRGDYAKQHNGEPDFKAKDEFYTPKEVVEAFMSCLDKEQFKNKVVYSPADDEQSEFVKWFKAHKEELKLKDYIYTSDDFNTHRDLFEKADIVITNPPFSKILQELMPLLLETGCKYALMANNMSCKRYKIKDNNIQFISHRDFPCNCTQLYATPFLTSQQNDYNCDKHDVTYMTTLKVNDDFEKSQTNRFLRLYKNKKLEDIKVFDSDETPVIDYTLDFPVDYDGWVLSPVTILDRNNIFEYDIERKPEYKFSDSKSRFVRIYARKNKNNSVWQELEEKNKKHLE